jgi:hypothetical protein
MASEGFLHQSCDVRECGVFPFHFNPRALLVTIHLLSIAALACAVGGSTIMRAGPTTPAGKSVLPVDSGVGEWQPRDLLAR